MKKFKYDLAIHVPFFKESLRAEIPLVRALFFVAGHYEEEGKSIRALLDEKLGCLGYRCEIRSWGGGKPNTAVYATVNVTHTRTKFRNGSLYEVEYKRGYLYNIFPLEQAPESKDFGALIKHLRVITPSGQEGHKNSIAKQESSHAAE